MHSDAFAPFAAFLAIPTAFFVAVVFDPTALGQVCRAALSLLLN